MALNVKKTLLKAKGLAKKGDLQAAAATYRQVLEQFPQNREARQALAELTSAATTQPVAPASEAQIRHVISLYSDGRLTQARGPAEQLSAAHPSDPLLQNLVGAIRAGLGLLESARESLERAVTLKPDYVEAHENLAAVYSRLRLHDKSADCYETILRIGPASAATKANLYFERAKLARWRAIWPLDESVANAGVAGAEINPFKMLVFDDHPGRNRARAENYANRLYRRPELGQIKLPSVRPKRIKIGYFSADFHDHATMYLMVRLFELHDHSAFEVFAYSYGPDSDGEMRQRLKAVTEFYDVRHLSDKAIAELARKHGVDIAVDLKGYTENARTGLFAYRAAPIQINYLGYPGTMGAPFIDYVVADEIVAPRTDTEAFSEKLIYLPNSYQVNDDTRVVATHCPSKEAFGLPSQGLVFCCFNNTHKISPREYDIWMRLLLKVNGSVLWLLRTGDQAQANLQQQAEKRGVQPDRIVFADRAPLSEHLARQKHADLFLDTFNYNAHTTTSDALWVGLPVLTLKGEGFPARVAASLLTAAGVTETICHDEHEYEQRALELARKPALIKALKERLISHRSKSALFDTSRFTKDLESAFRAVYERHVNGLAPDHIDVAALERLD